MTIGFIDNDIFLKLIAFQIFDEAIASLELCPADLRVLTTAKFVFRQYRSQQRHYSDAIWKQAIDLIDQCKTTPASNFEESPEIQLEIEQLKRLRKHIHLGEAELILATRTPVDFLLLSGDKNCLTALPQLPSHIYQRLCGRVICVEQLVLRMIDILGFKIVCDRIQPNAQYDKTIQICFGYSQPAPEDQVRAGLQNYINDINHLAPGLLADLG